MSLKDDLLRQADRDFGALKRALVGLSDDAMRRPWSGTWGVREILAHIAGWQREMIPVLERVARRREADPRRGKLRGPRRVERAPRRRRRGLTVEGVRAELDATHRDFLAAARAVPEARFGPDKTATRVVDLNGPHHYRDHTAHIRAWRRRANL